MAIRIETDKPVIGWLGAFLNRHSLARVNRELASELLKRGDLELALSFTEPADSQLASDASWKHISARSISQLPGTDVEIRHAWPPDFSPSSAKRYIHIQPWEFGSIPAAWVEGIARNVDEVWVPSTYVRDCYIQSGVPADKVVVVPNGVDTTVFHPEAKPASLPTTKSFKFLFVGGTIARKGIDILLDAYTSAFTAADDVALIIKDFGGSSVYQGQTAQELIAAIRANPAAPEIVYLDSEVDDEELAGIYTACDCLVHPYRGEGFGLPIAEAMACGLPVAVTNYGAALDFVDANCGYLIPATLERLPEKRIGDMVTVDYPTWAKPDLVSLTKLLSEIVTDSEGRKVKGKAGRETIEARFTWGRVAEIASERIKAVLTSKSVISGIAANSDASHEAVKQESLAVTRTGNWPEAEVSIRHALNVIGQDWDLENALAVVEYRLGKVEAAVNRLHSALERTPSPRDVHHNLAFILLGAGRPEAAAEHAIQALCYTPDNPDIRGLVQRVQRDLTLKLRRERKGGKLRNDRSPLKQWIQKCEEALCQTVVEPTPGAPTRPRLSVVMIAKNEERFLRECLQSVQGLADEIVVVDTGSSDSTISIAEEFGAVVGKFEWCDDFSAARNAALDLATGDWGLWLDADERVPEGANAEYRKLIESAHPQTGGLMMSLRNFMTSGPNPDVVYHRACRLFRLGSGVRFEGRIHEQNVRSLQGQGYQIAESDLVIDHFGYAAEIMDERNKHERFITMLTREVEENPDSFYHTFHCFNLGNAIYTKGDMAGSIKYFAMADQAPNPQEEYTVMLYTQWGTALYSTGKPGEALKVCDRAESIGMSHPNFDFVRGHACLHLKEYAASEKWFRRCLERGQLRAFREVGDAAVYGFKGQYGLALALTGQERYVEAIEPCLMAIGEKPQFTDARYLLGHCYLKSGELLLAVRELGKVVQESPTHLLAQGELGMALFDLKRFEEAITPLRKSAAKLIDNSAIWQRYAHCCQELGHWSESKSAFERVDTLLPNSAQVKIALGRAAWAAGDNDRAGKCFTDAISLDPSQANGYFNAADYLYSLGQYAPASEALHAGLTRDPRNASGFLVLGNCYSQLGDFEAAALVYREALRIKPGYVEAQNNLELAMEQVESSGNVVQAAA